jgi:hypothetical protein
MKPARALKSWRVLVCDTAMLPHVFRPRFNHKIFDSVRIDSGHRREWRPSIPIQAPGPRTSRCIRAIACKKINQSVGPTPPRHTGMESIMIRSLSSGGFIAEKEDTLMNPQPWADSSLARLPRLS